MVICLIQIWKRDDCLDFDLWDPNLYQLPAPQEYNSLKDPNMRAYLSNERMHKRLIRHGLITREGGVLCPLEDFNRYRRYLHNFNLNVVKTHEVLLKFLKYIFWTFVTGYG